MKNGEEMVGVFDVRKYRLDNGLELEVNKCRDYIARNNGMTRVVKFMDFGSMRIRDMEEGDVLGRMTKEGAS